jgi:hypothetical protein
MADDNSTGETPLDLEDWEIVFRVYAGSPVLALILAQHFDYLKGLIHGGPQGTIEGVTALDCAIDALMPHTEFKDAETYRLAVTGNLKP